MTKEELKAIRKNVSFNDVSIHDVIPLLAEVERLRKAAIWEEDQVLRMVSNAHLRGAQETREQMQGEVDRLTAEVEMLRGVGCAEDGDGPCGVCRKCAFQRGVAKMREAAAHLVEHKPRHSPPAQGTGFAQFGCGYCDMAAQVRALPDPEDK